jgi:hypothetical protein
MDGLQDNQSTRVKVITNHLVEATSKEVGPVIAQSILPC